MDPRAIEFAKKANAQAKELVTLQASDDCPKDSAPLTDEERAAAKALRQKAIGQVGNAIKMVRGRLAALEAKEESKKSKDAPMASTARIPTPDRVPGILAELGQDTDEVVVPGSASDFAEVTETLAEMTDGAKNVISDFDEVLTLPFLDEFNATLETVPVIGIQDRKLMYSKHAIVDGTGSTKFEEFDDLPDDAPQDVSSAKVFPFNGDLYLSIGTAVWRKESRNGQDAALVGAVNNWPSIYRDGWIKVGESTFPAGIIDACFFGQLTDPDDFTSELISGVVLLNSDGQLSASKGSVVSTDFVPVTFTPSASSAGIQDPPVWEKIAYTRNDLYAIADGVIWTLSLSFNETAGSYTMRDSTTVGEVVEMEGNEIGLVLRRNSDFLYQQFIDVADTESGPVDDFTYEHPEAATADPDLVALSYRKWVGVSSNLRMIGVASPGVKLDMRTLTAALKQRYLQTQTVLYPVVEKINTFAFVHTFYLDYLQSVADQYPIGSPPPDEETIAQAANYVSHINLWSGLINDAVVAAKDTVNDMASDAANIKDQLTIQLVVIEEELVVLERELNVLEDAKDDFRNQLLGALALTILGALTFLAISVVSLGAALPFAFVLGGTLFLGGILWTGFAIKGLVDTEKLIAEAEADIRTLTTTSERLQVISENYDSIDTAYTALNTFWGRMFNTSNTLGDIVGVFEILGSYLLNQGQAFNIAAAQGAVKTLSDGCTAYLDLLNAQGVQVTSAFRVSSDVEGELTDAGTFTASSRLGPISETELISDSAEFSQAASYGMKLLKAKDIDGYMKYLGQEIAPRGKIAASLLNGEIMRVRM